MRTTKAYLAGLGTTGVLIASILAVMVIGTGIVGFDGQELRDGGRPLDRVVVDHDADGARAERRPRRTGDAARSPLAAAESHRVELAQRTRGAGRRQTGTAVRRRSDRHGGVQVTVDVLGGGAGAGTGTGGRRGSPVTQPAVGRAENGGVAPGGENGGGAEPRSSPPPSRGRDIVSALGGGLEAPLAPGLLP
jgi:hypothetical protein